ncbi:DUF5134 domain-containing protein [Nocardia sp. X0981]
MAEFEIYQMGMRLLVAAAFAVAALVVLARVFGRPVLVTGERGGAAHCADGDHESDAAHLLMCAVMLIMVLFPQQLNGHALHGLLLAMTLVFALLFADRAVRWYRERPARPGHPVAALAYHVVAAGVMLYTMSGHSGAGHTAVPQPLVAFGFAALFLMDAVVVLVTARTGRGRRWSAHPVQWAPGRGLPSAILPHLIMDLGMAYMLIAGAVG